MAVNRAKCGDGLRREIVLWELFAGVPAELVCDRVRVWNDHCFRIQSEPSRPIETTAEVVERVVRFVVRSTTD
jgi:hypothetical protein